MGIVIAQELLSRRYEARLWSLAAFFHFACYIALIIVPFIIAYSSQCARTWMSSPDGRKSARHEHVPHASNPAPRPSARASQLSGSLKRPAASSPRSIFSTRCLCLRRDLSLRSSLPSPHHPA